MAERVDIQTRNTAGDIYTAIIYENMSIVAQMASSRLATSNRIQLQERTPFDDDWCFYMAAKMPKREEAPQFSLILLKTSFLLV